MTIVNGVPLVSTLLDFAQELFTFPQGSSIYFLLMMLFVLGSFWFALELPIPVDGLHYRRYRVALAGVVVAWLVLLGGVVYAQVTGQEATRILPPLERTVMSVSVLLVGWAFLTADHDRMRRTTNLVLLLFLALIVAGYMYIGAIWSTLGDPDFNLHVFGLAGSISLLAISLLGMVLSLFLVRSVLDAPLKLVYFAVLAAASGLMIYQTSNFRILGSDPGLLRLGFLLSFLLVPIILYRTMTMIYRGKLQQHPDTQRVAPVAQPATQRRVTTPSIPAREMQSVQLLKALGMMLDGASPDTIPQKIVETVLMMLDADVGAILRVQDANYADLTHGMDRTMGRKLVGMALNLDDQPTLFNAIERRQQRALYVDRNLHELQDLYTRLDIENLGAVYFQPLSYRQEVYALLLVGLPYSQRELESEQVELLKGIGIIASNMLMLSYEAESARKSAEDRIIQAMVDGVAPSDVQQSEVLAARQEMQANLSLAREQIRSLNEQVSSLKREIDAERKRHAELLGMTDSGSSISQQILTKMSELEELREEREQLFRRVQEAEAVLQGANATDDAVIGNQMVEARRIEKQSLEGEVNQLQEQLEQLRSLHVDTDVTGGEELMQQLSGEVERLQTENSQLSDKLDVIESQLEALGLEDGTMGLSRHISELYEERVQLRDQNQMLMQERDTLLQERQQYQERLAEQKDREERLRNLEKQIEQLANDREAITKQRDQLRAQLQEVTENLNKVKVHRAKLVAQNSVYEMDLASSQAEQAQFMNQLRELKTRESELVTERDQLLAENQSLTMERDQLLANFEGDLPRYQEVNENGVGTLRQMIQELTKERDQLTQQLTQALSQLQVSQHKLESARAEQTPQETVAYELHEPELLVGLVQELRTPMTSISGYIDLLLAESAGILGEMQRKFLHRVAANVARLDSMVDSLIDLTELDRGNYRLQPHPVDVVQIVDQAITNSSMQFREKNLVVSLDIEPDLPQLSVDRDALNQVIGQLFTNAYLISPPKSEVIVTVGRRTMRLSDHSQPRPCLYVAVEDKGGGIEPEDVPRVFSRKYKAENPLISGLGDTGVGMSLAKALVEAHEGRLWVDSKVGEGSIFAFVIPLDLQAEMEGE
jgi:signal transduction histidine kinase/predicted  nucleic acid-binding Zn-ribbon protein